MPDLNSVVTHQRAVNFCIPAEILLLLARTILIMGGASLAQVVPKFIYVGASVAYPAAIVVGAFFVFKLATTLYSVTAGVLLGILALIPIFGLVVLLIVNGNATKLLRAHGVYVGPLGAHSLADPADASASGRASTLE